MSSLKQRIALAAAAVVAVSQAATIALVLQVAETDAERRAFERLDIGSGVVADYMNSHTGQLDTTVNVLAADYAFRSAIASLDMPTVTSVLRNHANRIGADQSMLIGGQGQTLASSPRNLAITPSTWKHIIESPAALITLDDQDALYQMVIAPVRAPELIGWVAMGFRIDDVLAMELRNLIGMDVSFARRDDGAILASSLTRAQRSRSIDDGAYFTRSQPLPGVGSQPNLVLQLSRADALASYHALSQSMLALGALALFIAVCIASFTSDRLTRHLKALADVARRISTGDYTTAISIRTNDEVETLADALTTMQQGIADREKHILRQATHDALTDLPNHEHAVMTLNHWIEQASTPFTAMVLHVYGLQDINSSLGLEVGDSVIRSVARCLTEQVGSDDHLARIADNRFLVATRECDREKIGALARRLRSEFEVFSPTSEIQVGLSLQVGVAEFPAHARDAASLVRKAWGASLEANQSSTGVGFYNVDRDAQHQRRLTITRDIRSAVLDDQLSLVYQPKYNVRARRVDGVEALLRWHHPTLGPVPVTEFIEVAEQTRNIGRLTRWVLRRALSQMSAWRARGHMLSVAVNVSAHDLTDGDFPHYVNSVLADHDLAGAALELEVTEGALVYDLGRARRTLEALQAAGVTIAIDDYGTGFSSLAQIRDLPVHALKIDKSFVMHLNGSADNEHIVKSTIDLGHALELEVIAEGVEDKAAVDKLERWGCDRLQGYYFAKPLPATEVEALFTRTSGSVSALPVRAR